MKRMKSRIFAFTLGLSLFVLITLAGCVIVDYQGRRLSFGEDQPPFQVERLPGNRSRLEVDLFGVEAKVDFTQAGRILDLLRDFFCLPRS